MTMEHFGYTRIETPVHPATPLLISQPPVLGKVNIPYVNQVFALQPQAFFCRIESQIERKSRIAPRFRLGSLDYTNWLEGKSDLKE